MDINKFEERIKSAFEGHRPEADTDAIWEHIEPQLKKKKKRRGIIWFFWGLGLGLLLLWNIGEQGPAVAPSISSHSPASSAGKAALDREIAPFSKEKVTAASLGNSARSDAREAAAGKQTASRPVVERTLVGSRPSQRLAETTEYISPQEVAPGSIDIWQEAAASVRTGPMKVILPLAMLAWDAVHRDSVPDTSILQMGRALKDIGKSDQQKKAVIGEEDMPKDRQKRDRRKRVKRGKPQWAHELGLQAGPALAIKQLREREGVIAPAGHLKKRQTTEHTLESLTAGLFYSAATQYGLVLKTGLHYRQSNEKFHLGYFKKETEQINGVLTLTVNSAGNTIEQTTGIKTVTKTTEYSHTVYNHYRFVNLPVGLGYRHTGKKSRWEWCGGMDLNLFFHADGTIYNKYDVLTAFEYGSSTYENTFRNNTGLGLWLSYAYDRRLTEQLRWQLSANAQVPLRPVSSPEYALVQRYFNFGVQVGVVYEIKKRE